MNTQAPMTDVPPDELVGAKAELVDEARQIYRFSNGVCRALADIPAPWKLSRGAYDDEPIHPRVLSLEAPNTAFDIPPPGLRTSGSRRQGRGQVLIDLVLAPPNAEYSVELRASMVLNDPEQWGWPKKPPVEVSRSFESYTNNDLNIALVNKSMGAVVYCIDGAQSNLPNPRCQGFMFLSAEEKARFFISYEGLSRLQEIFDSIGYLAKTIRVECPKGVDGDE